MSNSELSSAELRAMLAAAVEREQYVTAAADAADAVTDAASVAIRDAVALLRGGRLAGLPIDLAAVLAAAVERATPAAPEAVAAVIAPDAPAAPAAPAGATRRERRRVERVWHDVESGSIWRADLAGRTGRVRITVDPDGMGASFTATTGNRAGGTLRNPSRAAQNACGNPPGRGRKGEATVNGFLGLTLVRDAAGNDVTDGPTLDAVTAV